MASPAGRTASDLHALGFAIKAARQRSGLSQSAFGARYRLTQGQVSKLETGTMREFSSAVERAVIRIVGRALYTGVTRAQPPPTPGPAQAMQAPWGMTPQETGLMFPLIRSALELVRSGRTQEVLSLTMMAGAFLRGVQVLEHPEVQKALGAASQGQRHPSKGRRARPAR